MAQGAWSLLVSPGSHPPPAAGLAWPTLLSACVPWVPPLRLLLAWPTLLFMSAPLPGTRDTARNNTSPGPLAGQMFLWEILVSI